MTSRAASRNAIVVVSLEDGGFGGLETHVLNLAAQLVAAGRTAVLVVPRSSPMHMRAMAENLECHPVRWPRWVRGTVVRDYFLFRTLVRVGRSIGVCAIHCNNRYEASGARRAARRLGAAVVLNCHVPDEFDVASIAGVDAVVAPNADLISFISRENIRQNLRIGSTRQIPPLLDAKRFLAFSDGRHPRDWFRESLNISMSTDPIVCMIGNMVSDLEHKNFPLLFRAMAELCHRRHFPIQAVLVGDGVARHHLETLAATLNIRAYVHFVGYRTAEVPGIIAMSDFCVLASSHEAFGIVLVEAALMQKAAIAARRTGAEQIIINDDTGLLFENSSETALADAIELLARNPRTAARLGRNAYERALRHFVPEAVVKQYLNVYAAAG